MQANDGSGAGTGPLDLLIKDILIVDGSGVPSFSGSIGVRGERIVSIGDVKAGAKRIIRGGGLVACPGFIDSHSHADLSILAHPLAENLIMQGITTFVGGNCGISLSPMRDRAYFSEVRKAWGLDFEPAWATFGEWLSAVERRGLSPNYVPLAGHNAVRGAVLGTCYHRTAGDREIGAMADLVEEAFDSGAFGLTMGLDANMPGHFASRAELLRLLESVRRRDALFSPHTRHHQNQWPSDSPEENAYGLYQGPKGEIATGRYHGLLEAVELAKLSGVRLLIAHVTPAYSLPMPHPGFLDEALVRGTLEEIQSLAGGLPVYFSVIPAEYSIGSRLPVAASFFNANLSLPPWLAVLEKEEFASKLRDAFFAERVKNFVYSGKFKFGMIHPCTDPYWGDCYRILTCKKKEYEGRTIGELGRELYPQDISAAVYSGALEALFDVIASDPDATWALIRDKREYGCLSAFLRHPASVPMTDVHALPAALDKAEDIYGYGISPSAYGMFPRYLSEFVKQNKVLSLEEGIRRLTSLPALDIFKIKDRGLLRKSMYADIVLLDMNNLKAEESFMRPELPPGGIEYVIVNGVIAYENMAHTGAKSGKVLRRGT